MDMACSVRLIARAQGVGSDPAPALPLSDADSTPNRTSPIKETHSPAPQPDLTELGLSQSVRFVPRSASAGRQRAGRRAIPGADRKPDGVL